ncbi:MAG: B-box zinc finger protein [Deltaproteobacteria bacterium]|nr:B-box zinc finger protein [Deltaproteobacteria bacterium]
MKCAHHPDVETNLRCGKCDKPICPKCMVQTPVGARCRDCAGLDKLPTFSVSTRYYLIASGTALGMAIACGAAWGLIAWLVPMFFFNLLLAAAAGYAIGEVTSLAVNRKRGTGLAVVGGIAVAISYAVTFLFPGGLPIGIFSIIYHIIAVGLGIFIAVTRLR